VTQAPAQRGVTVQGGQFAEQLTGGGKQHGVAVDERLVGDIARQGGLAHTVGAGQHDVGGLLEEVQGDQLLDGGPIASFRPCPVEVAQGLEAPDVGLAHAPLQRAAGALIFFPLQQRLDPLGGGDVGPAGEQAMQLQGFGPQAKGFKIAHRGCP
jgi:hypothetical protein